MFTIEEAAAKAEAAAKDLSTQQGVAVLGLALVAMGEDIGSEMLFRHFGHLLRYSEPVIRRAVPLALGLISVSNPQLNILDTLSKFSHDADSEVILFRNTVNCFNIYLLFTLEIHYI